MVKKHKMNFLQLIVTENRNCELLQTLYCRVLYRPGTLRIIDDYYNQVGPATGKLSGEGRGNKGEINLIAEGNSISEEEEEIEGGGCFIFRSWGSTVMISRQNTIKQGTADERTHNSNKVTEGVSNGFIVRSEEMCSTKLLKMTWRKEID
jgi:hypothetical protein